MYKSLNLLSESPKSYSSLPAGMICPDISPMLESNDASIAVLNGVPFKNIALSRDACGISNGKFGSHRFVAASNKICGLVAVLSN